jgi:hypothetical protein
VKSWKTRALHVNRASVVTVAIAAIAVPAVMAMADVAVTVAVAVNARAAANAPAVAVVADVLKAAKPRMQVFPTSSPATID